MLLPTSRISDQMPMIRVKSIGQQNMVIRERQQKNIKKRRNFSKLLPSDSCRIQTCNLLIRSQMLYSVELTNRFYYVFLVIRAGFKPATF